MWVKYLASLERVHHAPHGDIAILVATNAAVRRWHRVLTQADMSAVLLTDYAGCCAGANGHPYSAVEVRRSGTRATRETDMTSGRDIAGGAREFDIEAVMDLSDLIASLQDLSDSDEQLDLRGLTVDGTWDEVDDPILLGPDGRPVDT